MKYPYSVSMEDYYNWDFDRRCEVDQWLKDQGIISEITRSFTLTSSVICNVEQIEVVDGKITQEKTWPHGPKITRKQFKVNGNELSR